MNQDEVIKNVFLAFRRHLPNPSYSLYLVGSRARGTNERFSDFDFVIRGPAAVDRALFTKLKNELSQLKTLYSIDLVDFETASKDFQTIASKSMKEVVDGSIQRFEFCFDLAWKTLKRCLEFEGFPLKAPRDVLQQAFKMGWLPEGDDFWSQMIESRNRALSGFLAKPYV